MTTPEELAWAAGFFDGEGSVRAKWNMKGPRRNRAIHAIVGQREREPLDRFQAAVGVGKVYGPSYTQTRDGKPMWRWETGNRDYVHLVCWLLWPYLCSTKRNQFDNTFARYHEMKAETRRDGG